MSDLPDPLTPLDCDLRGLEFMPLDTVRLLDSDLFALSTGEEFKAALSLWCKSWLQVPAASLPDDERVLAFLSGAGARWKKVRDIALRNWVKCSDGRLYHPVVAEKAMEAFARRSVFQENRSAETGRKEREREDRKRMFAELRAAGVELAWNVTTGDLRKQYSDHMSRQSVTTGHENGVTSHAPVTARTGTGTGTIPPTPNRSHIAQPDIAAVMKAGGMISIPSDAGLVREWLALPDMQLERDILPVVAKVAEREMSRTGRAPFKMKLFDAAVRQQHAEDAAAIDQMRRTRERIERAESLQRTADEAA